MYVGDFATIVHNVKHWVTECHSRFMRRAAPKTCDVTRVKNYECPVNLTGTCVLRPVQSPSEDPADC